NFKGVEHRLEYVATIDGRDFYNDTEATNIKCTQIALSSFNNPILIILGGLERNQVLEDLTPYMKNVKAVLSIGQCRERVKEYVESLGIKCITHEYMKDGFKELYDLSSEGDVILLSPATASWDQYKECEERGTEFKDLVKKLKED
ncbi:MAG: UDP-N-acetylmuramoyl-L-alanine--D-glutamate ligase, partial [Bacilli bacterium]|nr:UDP-N-acetylmuramoyl-L-alanine--D-glutamate ligase [Bacilli bacterium]